MSTKVKAQGIKDVADEAIFQIACSKEFAGWMFSLMTAILDDHKHAGGHNSAGLAGLGAYLAEGCISDTENSIDELNIKLATIGGVL